MVIGKMMHIIIYNENNSAELMCENNDVLVNYLVFVLAYCIIFVKCEGRLFRVTPYHFNTDFILRDRKPMVEI
jgi:hypothetical protein